MYRPDIDGIRALAVVSVLFYHLGVTGFSGGFVGVDVFFVISGFLITRLILTDLEEGKFSFLAFYGRRARRLFPAFFFMVITSSIAAYLLFTPEHFARFSGAVVYALGSISNFYFYGESGYFDANAYLKPLLHTWSLGVEEQFYFIWPFILVLMLKQTHKWAAPLMLLLLGGISIIYTEKLLLSDPGAAFYLVPFRVMEFAIGGALVWCMPYRVKNKMHSEIMAISGILLIVYPVYAYTDETVFPGISALLPCFGTALLIFCGPSKVVGRLLSNIIVVRTGLISYSLYLAHWPIIVFYKYYKFDQINVLSSSEIVCLLVITFVVAIFMYIYIETPFRKKAYQWQNLSTPAFGFICALCSLLLIIPAASAWATGGWLWRYTELSESARNELKIENDDFRLYAYKKIIELDKQSFLNNSKKKVLIIGDSQAGDFINMIFENKYHELVDLSAIVIGAKCQPVFLDTITRSKHIGEKYKKICNAQHKKYMNSTKLDQAEVVVLVAAWRRWGVNALNDTIKQIKKRGVKEVYVLGPKAQGESGQTLLARFRKKQGIEGFSAKRINVGSKHMNTILKSNDNYSYIDILKYICPDKNHCHVLTPNDKVIFFDKSHVSPEGAKYLGRILYEAGELSFMIKN